MAKLQIVKIGNPLLRRKIKNLPFSQLKTRKFKKIFQQMVRAMRRMNGVGLAANQVGLNHRVVVLECRSNPRYPRANDFPLEIWINPKIIKYSKEKEEGWEGCLSIPGYRGLVPRAKWVTFEALTPEGEKVRQTVKGFHARVIQHEVDHVNGFFYMDRMKHLHSWMHLDEFNHRSRSHVKDH